MLVDNSGPEAPKQTPSSKLQPKTKWATFAAKKTGFVRSAGFFNGFIGVRSLRAQSNRHSQSANGIVVGNPDSNIGRALQS